MSTSIALVPVGMKAMLIDMKAVPVDTKAVPTGITMMLVTMELC